MEFLALLLALLTVVFVLMPVLTFVRMGRLSRELETLRARIDRLERPAASASPGTGPAFAAAGAPAAPSPLEALISPEAPAPVAPSAPLAPVAPTAVDIPDDLEDRIGGRGLLYTGVLVLLFGVSFFLKYAFENQWINETGRVVLGALGGLGLVVAGLRMSGRGLGVFGQALAGGGFAILYLAIYAAFNFYALIGTNVAFGAMLLVTLAAAVAADRQRAQALAVLAVGGGFMTPFLVGGAENAQLTLFSYDALLVIGTMVLALRHQWLGLNALSYTCTVFTLLAWAGRYYTEDQWLRTLLFLTLFCVLFLIILRATSRAAGAVAHVVTTVLATAPLLYHLFAVTITAAHPPAIHIYLIAFTAAGLWLTADPHRPWLRLVVLLGGFIPLFGTLTLPDGMSWVLANVVTIVAVAALHTMALLNRIVRQEERLAGPDLLALQITGLGLFSLLYESLQPSHPDLRGALAAGIAFAAVALWQWLTSRDRVASLNAAALAFTLGAIAVAVQFDGRAAVIGWAAEAAAAVWLGLRAPSLPFQYGGLLLWGMAALRLADGYFTTPAGFTAVLNERSLAIGFVVAMAYALAWMFARHRAEATERTRVALHVAASVLTLLWLTAEIRSYWEVRYENAQAYLYEHVMLSLAWGLYGALLIAIGMRQRYAAVRYIGITILAVASLKVFFYDLWELGGIYRVVGFLAFGVLLVLVSYLYQRRRLVTPPSEAPAPARVGETSGTDGSTPNAVNSQL
ncbi:MAG TPA: DUF2339 domain-containing protein [Vicinamibacterales bacterium]|nr:DUF2339 domain-containing protein [Vicinamibacterales bacterium]